MVLIAGFVAYVSLPGNAPLAFTEIDYYVDVINAATAAFIERGYALVVAPSTAGSAVVFMESMN